MAGGYAGPPVVVLGDVLVDHIYRVVEMPPVGGDAVVRAHEEHPGGAGLNTSTGLAHLGIPVVLASTVGEDAQGQRLASYLSGHKIDIDAGALARRGATGHVLSIVDVRGERTMLSYRGAAADPVAVGVGGALDRALECTPLLFLSGYGLQTSGLRNDLQARSYLAAARRVREHGGLVAFDPTPMAGALAKEYLGEALALTDILLPNEAELSALTGLPDVRAAIDLILRRVSCVGVKLGRRGALVASRSAFPPVSVCPAREVRVVDTTGAGDAFNAGFLAAVVSGLSPGAWGEWGNELAVKAVGKAGAALFDF